MRDFSDIQSAVLNGFITSKVQIHHNCIVMKSISAKKRMWASKLYFSETENNILHELALSIYMWNNCNLLINRKRDYLHIVDILKSMPMPFLTVLLRNYQILVRRLYKAGEDLQGFVFTEGSR